MSSKQIKQENINAPAIMLGVGHYFPGEPVGNDTIHREYGFDEKWIVEHTGVIKRHWADDSKERFVDIAQKAGEMALKDAGLSPEDIDILICTSSTTRATFNPSTRYNKYMDVAPPLQAVLGLKNAFVFDIGGVACVGFVDVSVTATSLLRSMKKKNAMVVCVENPKPVLNFKFKNSTLFGAGAVAVIWQSCPREESGLIDAVIHTDGSNFNNFDIDDENKILMKGKNVGSFAPKALVSASREILERNHMELDDIDWFIPHQANINIINEVKETLNISPDKLLINIERRGNTSSVGGPSCFSEYYHEGKIKKGDLVYNCSFGRGYNWGGILFRA